MWIPPKVWNIDGEIDIEDWQRIEDDTRWIAEFYGTVLNYKT